MGRRGSKSFASRKVTALKNFEEHEKNIALNATFTGFYSALQVISDLIKSGKTLADIDTYCLAELSNQKQMQDTTTSIYLNNKDKESPQS